MLVRVWERLLGEGAKGIGSRGHVVGWLERRSLDTSASVRGQKEKMGDTCILCVFVNCIFVLIF